MKRILVAAAMLFGVTMQAHAEDPIKITVIQDVTGSAVLESYANQVYRGFDLGIQWATEGTGKVLGRDIEVIRKDTTIKPDRARALLAEAYEDGSVIVVGSTSSGITKSMLPVAQDYEKILLVAPAVADSITGEDWNRFIFKSSRNNSFDMQAQAIAMRLDENTSIGIIGEDYAFVRDGAAALKEAVKKYGATVAAEEFVEVNATDLTPALERIAQKMENVKGRKILFAYFGFLPNYMGKIMNWGPERHDIEPTSIVTTLPTLESFKSVPGMEGAAFYYYDLENNEINDWFVAEHQKQFGTPPDFFTVEGFAAASAVVTALKKANSTETEDLIAAMEGMEFPSVRGPRTFRAEDHQAMMPMYHVKLANEEGVAWAVPKLVRKIEPEEFDIPIRNKR
ncbi:ABC transporter substrate-binding protein [Sneathiella chungangensis]|uniref:ABC transporter substrate-binding protein n=1 Tax=Sneathiella chungangensis TaxID=1418234 RepID=A0A845MGS6_9PROT|nr:substrate-binding domain-containing protein [Sneathiella chungangensis]MZR23208.1 ABC transporter substrate-binding protein [Sneathiella chungangensis]